MPPFITLKRAREFWNRSNFLENTFAACMLELQFELYPVIRTILRGRSFSQVMPFLCELSPRESGKDETGRRICLLSGELSLPKLWEDRVSRLIGKFDTTAKVCGWQVGVGRR
jgi:hypothetical protein